MAAEITLTKALQPLVVGLKRIAPTLGQAVKPYTPPSSQSKLPLKFEAKPQPSSSRFSSLFKAYTGQPIIPHAQITFKSYDLLPSAVHHQEPTASSQHLDVDTEDELESFDLVECPDEELQDTDSGFSRSNSPTSDLGVENPFAFREGEDSRTEASILAPLQKELEATQRDLDGREEDLHLAMQENAQLREENKSLQAFSEEQQMEIAALREQLQYAESALQSQAQRGVSLKEQDAIIDELTQDLNRAEAKLEAKTEALAKNQRALALARSEANETIEALEDEIAATHVKITGLEKRLKIALKEKADLEGENTQMDAEIDTLLVELDQLRFSSQRQVQELKYELEQATQAHIV